MNLKTSVRVDTKIRNQSALCGKITKEKSVLQKHSAVTVGSQTRYLFCSEVEKGSDVTRSTSIPSTFDDFFVLTLKR